MINVAVVGCGAISSVHLRALEKNPGTRVAAVCDIDRETADACAKMHRCKAYYDLDALLADPAIQSVHICTPHYLHASMALKVLGAGRHLLLEKPLATSLDGARAVIRASEASPCVSGVCFQNRYNDTAAALQKALASPRSCAVRGARAFVTWHRTQAYYRSGAWRGRWDTEGGGTLINQAIHTVDLLLWLVGGERAVTGSIATRLLRGVVEVEDFAEALISFDGGVNALLYATTGYCEDAPVELEIACENAVYRLMDNVLTVSYRDGSGNRLASETVTGEKAYWGTGHARLIADFYDCVHTGRRFPIPPREAFRALSAVLGIYRSAKTGESVPLADAE